MRRLLVGLAVQVDVLGAARGTGQAGARLELEWRPRRSVPRLSSLRTSRLNTIPVDVQLVQFSDKHQLINDLYFLFCNLVRCRMRSLFLFYVSVSIFTFRYYPILIPPSSR